MLSSIFIDRPRLAVVISIVITVAGFVALLQIPIAQFPVDYMTTACDASLHGKSAPSLLPSVPVTARTYGVKERLDWRTAL